MVRRFSAVTVGVVTGGACIALAIFLHKEGLVRAGAWAGVIALLGIPISILGVWLAWPSDHDRGSEHRRSLRLAIQRNTSTQQSTIFAVQDGEQTVNYARPASAPSDKNSQKEKESAHEPPDSEATDRR